IFGKKLQNNIAYIVKSEEYSDIRTLVWLARIDLAKKKLDYSIE
ncbi:11500_t:CDS:1, partial [Gigaspora rosea]